jgi:hypothetical protein
MNDDDDDELPPVLGSFHHLPHFVSFYDVGVVVFSFV